MVCVCVCLSVTTFPPTSRNKTAKKRYVRLHHYTSLILKRAIFVKVLCSKVMALKASEQANMQMSTGLPDQILLVFCTMETSDFHEERGPVQCCLQRYIHVLASYARCRVELHVLFAHIYRSPSFAFSVYFPLHVRLTCTCAHASLARPRPNISAEGLHFSAFHYVIK